VHLALGETDGAGARPHGIRRLAAQQRLITRYQVCRKEPLRELRGE
jgi:hypothetical protein